MHKLQYIVMPAIDHEALKNHIKNHIKAKPFSNHYQLIDVNTLADLTYILYQQVMMLFCMFRPLVYFSYILSFTQSCSHIIPLLSLSGATGLCSIISHHIHCLDSAQGFILLLLRADASCKVQAQTLLSRLFHQTSSALLNIFL